MNILCVCAQGMNRSKFAAKYFSELGFETRYKGSTMGENNPLEQEDFDWANAIVYLTSSHQEFVHKKFGVKDKEFVLNVTDHPGKIPEMWLRVKVSDPKKFYTEFTFPRMLTALESVEKKLTQ